MTRDDLTRRRQALGFSLQELSRQLGVSYPTVTRREAGVVQPPPLLDLALEALERRTPGDGAVSSSSAFVRAHPGRSLFS